MFNLIFSQLFSTRNSLGPIWGIVMVMLVVFGEVGLISVILPLVPVLVVGYLVLKFTGILKPDVLTSTLKSLTQTALSQVAPKPRKAAATFDDFVPSVWDRKTATVTSGTGVPNVVAQKAVVPEAEPMPPIPEASFDAMPDLPLIQPRMTALELARTGLPRKSLKPRVDPRAQFAAQIAAQKAHLAESY